MTTEDYLPYGDMPNLIAAPNKENGFRARAVNVGARLCQVFSKGLHRRDTKSTAHCFHRSSNAGQSLLKNRQIHVLLWNNKTCRRIPFDSAKPDAIGGVDVHQSAEDIVIGGGKVSHQFLVIEGACSFNQSAAGPRGLVQMFVEVRPLLLP